jgi:FkbM family methyltransferase
MKPHEQNVFNRVGKTLAKPLSRLVAGHEDFARLLEAYWCILLGKGAGSGWALDAEINAAKSVINNPYPVIFDVGANIGDWSLLMHKSLPQARIFMFEPQPDCQQIIKDKHIPNAILIPNAVSSTKHTVKLYRTESKSPMASLHQRGDSYSNKNLSTSIDVETTTIDDVVESFSLTGIDFIKMDIEGHELEALNGAARSMERGVIKALSFEFGFPNVNSRTFFRDFWDLLHPLNYQIYRILPSSRLMPVKEYYEDCEYFRGATNYVAVLRNSKETP